MRNVQTGEKKKFGSVKPGAEPFAMKTRSGDTFTVYKGDVSKHDDDSQRVAMVDVTKYEHQQSLIIHDDAAKREELQSKVEWETTRDKVLIRTTSHDAGNESVPYTVCNLRNEVPKQLANSTSVCLRHSPSRNRPA